ncbi:barstar family protein [Nocardia sp. NBC_01329]|uniref:barstar family protein n=1 Tax=Nocardia sp. NBC_01329 TaxID=2903594 RepID=UPI002E132D66|nr:barstar family protein [Nocardia sp. NBC_01329]
MRATIDGTQIRTHADLHNALSGPLDFGPYYGHNLNALWDRLTTDVERPVEIVWESSGVSRELMGVEAFEAIASVLIEAAELDVSNPVDARLTVRFA